MENHVTAERVRQNLRAVRKGKGLDLKDVVARLAELGHPLALSVLSKMELGQRRVDVDDLVALALALEVTPNRLLLGPTPAGPGEVAVTPGRTMSEVAAWGWATGDDFEESVGFEQALERTERGEFNAVAKAVAELREQGWALRDVIATLRLMDQLVALGRARRKGQRHGKH